MKRYNEFVLEAEKGITFDVSEGTSGELIIRALNSNAAKVSDETGEESIIEAQDISTTEISEETNEESIIEAQEISTTEVSEETSEDSITRNQKITTANVCSENYANPPIPEGYKHVCGEWNNGFVIERDSDGSQFVWIPVGSLDSNGTLDGEHFSEKFGRRKYKNDEFSDSNFNETLEGELLKQLGSVKKYGGFYISRYNISKGLEGKPHSVKGVRSWLGINFYDAKEVASTIEDNETVKSHLTFGAEYDSVLEWFIESGAKTLDEIAEEITEAVCFLSTENSSKALSETGSREELYTNNIYDFAGNADEWTQEQCDRLYYVVRSGNFHSRGSLHLVACRIGSSPKECYYNTAFRATLYIK